MKRLLVAVVLLAFTVALCIGSQVTVERRVERLLSALDDVAVVYRTSGAEVARPYVDHLLARMERESALLPLFLPHEPVDAAAESLCLLPALLDGDKAAFEAELARCRERLEQIREGERLTMKNLL